MTLPVPISQCVRIPRSKDWPNFFQHGCPTLLRVFTINICNLSPPHYDHLLTYSRHDQIWRFTQHSPAKLHYRSQISPLSSPVHVINIGDHGVTKHLRYDGTKTESMEDLKQHFINDNPNIAGRSSRIICTQHLTYSSMEALGVGLSMDPDVFSHHIGMSFKEIERSTSIAELRDIKITTFLPLSVFMSGIKTRKFAKCTLGDFNSQMWTIRKTALPETRFSSQFTTDMIIL